MLGLLQGANKDIAEAESRFNCVTGPLFWPVTSAFSNVGRLLIGSGIE